MPLTTAERINIGRLSALYTSNELASGRLQGGQIDKRLPHLIYAVTQGLVWANELLETTANLNKIGNYLISICRHDLRAQGVLSLDNGGTVAPINGGGAIIEDLDFIVSASSYIATGESAVTFDGTDGMPDLRGYNVRFARNGTVQYTTPPGDGSQYFAWNSVTGLFQLLPSGDAGKALVDEKMLIDPDATGGGGSSSAYAPTTISLSSDGIYTLPEGYLLWKISILPTAADTVKIGTTLAGDDIMFDKLMTVGVYGTNGVTTDVYAESADKTIYFTGFTAQATINIYLLPI